MKQKLAALLVTIMIFSSSLTNVLAESEAEVQYNLGGVYAGVTLATKNILDNVEISLETSTLDEEEVEEVEIVEEVVKKPVWKKELVGYVSRKEISVYKKADKTSKVIYTLYFNEKVRCYSNSDYPGWYRVSISGVDGYGYIKQNSVSKKIDYKSKDLPYNSSYHGFKSWMGHRCFGSGSDQYKLQQLCSTNETGLRVYNRRYCVAVGSYFNCSIGQYIDVVLENGTIIPCVMADLKADRHTDANNVYSGNMCATEFVCESKSLLASAKSTGDISDLYDAWDSKVVAIRIYSMNAFE